MGRIRRGIGTFLLICVSLLIAGILAEAGVRLVLGEQVKFPRHVVGAPFGVRINEPDARYRHKSPDVTVWFEINGQGMRAPEDYPYSKPPGTSRIVVLGDSFTIGYEVADSESFARVLERELRESGHQVQVLNAGVSGYGTAEACVYLERELLRYEPDVVLVAFFGNDLVDNVRSNLFRLDERGLLVEASRDYVPAGRLADFLNTNWFFNVLSERSDAFSLAKERITLITKRRMVRANQEDAVRAEEHGAATQEGTDYRERLAGAIYERIYSTARARDIPLVILSIPRELNDPQRLVEQFPLQMFATSRAGVWLLPAKVLLDPWLGRELLYWTRSHDHWTPFSHRLAGEALARLIEENGLLGRPTATVEARP